RPMIPTAARPTRPEMTAGGSGTIAGLLIGDDATPCDPPGCEELPDDWENPSPEYGPEPPWFESPPPSVPKTSAIEEGTVELPFGPSRRTMSARTALAETNTSAALALTK